MFRAKLPSSSSARFLFSIRHLVTHHPPLSHGPHLANCNTCHPLRHPLCPIPHPLLPPFGAQSEETLRFRANPERMKQSRPDHCFRHFFDHYFKNNLRHLTHCSLLAGQWLRAQHPGATTHLEMAQHHRLPGHSGVEFKSKPDSRRSWPPGGMNRLRCASLHTKLPTAVERIWHKFDCQGQILAMAFR